MNDAILLIIAILAMVFVFSDELLAFFKDYEDGKIATNKDMLSKLYGNNRRNKKRFSYDKVYGKFPRRRFYAIRFN